MSSGECKRPDDRIVDDGEVRYLHYAAKGFLSGGILNHIVFKKKGDKRISTNEENNIRKCIRMKN